jgi:hypothetical protein
MIWRDFVSGLRALRRSPGVSLVMAALLALGIGANAAIFSVVEGVLLRQVPYRDATRLVVLPAIHRPNDMGAEVSMANFLDWRRGSLAEIMNLESLGVFDNRTLLDMWCRTTAETIFPGRRIGRLEDGYEGSFLVLGADPIQAFNAVKNIRMRFKQGSFLPAPSAPAR